MAAAADTKTEDLSHGDPLELPALCPGAMANSKPYPASAAMQEPLGFPGQAGRRLA